MLLTDTAGMVGADLVGAFDGVMEGCIVTAGNVFGGVAVGRKGTISSTIMAVLTAMTMKTAKIITDRKSVV